MVRIRAMRFIHFIIVSFQENLLAVVDEILISFGSTVLPGAMNSIAYLMKDLMYYHL